MRHILDTPLGRMAKTQQDLAAIVTDSSTMAEETMTRDPLLNTGFYTVNQDTGLWERMDDRLFMRTVMRLLKSRPTARILDVKPDCPYTEVPLIIQSKELFNLTVTEKAEMLAREWVHRPKMVGFRFELGGVGEDRSNPKPGKVSFYAYEMEDDLEDTVVPVESIFVRYRSNW